MNGRNVNIFLLAFKGRHVQMSRVERVNEVGGKTGLLTPFVDGTLFLRREREKGRERRERERRGKETKQRDRKKGEKKTK